MAKHLTISRPYAKAIFQIASADQQQQEWLQLLTGLSMMVKDPEAQHLLHNPLLDKDALGAFFFGLLEEMLPTLPDGMLEKAKNTIEFLVYEKRMEILPDITELYQRYIAEQQGLVELSVLSAHQLDDAQKNLIQVALEQRFNSKVSVEFSLDKSLIGGLLIRTGNWVMDGSIRGKLSRLAEVL